MTSPAPQTPPSSWKKWLPLIGIVAGLLVAWQAGVLDLLSFDALYQQRSGLLELVESYGVLAAVLYALIYAVIVAFSLPAGAALTVLSGFLFGPIIGTIAVVGGATAGATALFIAARTALGETLRQKAGPFLAKMQSGFEENATSYMLFLRLVPAFPFWLVNIVPALMGVKLSTYVWTTFVGILPATFVFTLFGQGLDSVFEACDAKAASDPNFVCALPPASEIVTVDILIALVALAVLSLTPMIYRKITGKA